MSINISISIRFLDKKIAGKKPAITSTLLGPIHSVIAKAKTKQSILSIAELYLLLTMTKSLHAIIQDLLGD